MTPSRTDDADPFALTSMEIVAWWFVWLGALAHVAGAVHFRRAFDGLDTLALMAALAIPVQSLRALLARRRPCAPTLPVSAPRVYR